MFEADQICPYTGLRSFTEEESLYFKGREDDIDQATQQLQKNKFLMLTGASGDGKSSLIYAGIIPNARAGFLKSKYTRWCVADFRPERTPFQNLCGSVARQLEIDNVHSVEAELKHGFSAVIDLYKNSKRHIDTNSVVWQSADDTGKAKLKREAANLIILVDQFEEFFTNPENYNKGVPSVDANLVLNLLLETARIALDEDLPIYIVFTMRSDYIGQCAAFRGLPEYIGFSQFFVPRLNRTQLQQVIEEPSVLSGNRISRRLTERLIHDLTEGVDQLPILQHALNQVWHAADNGKEEMDLIHYAMVGGMPVNELPDERIERFEKWFQDLDPEIKACYDKPSLQNVLDTHTNKLYEQADEYYTARTGNPISGKDAKAIIRSAFICLTKIDQSRAVRNRMTLKEIVNILGKPEFGTKEVGGVLNIFREPGNTFIHPFILDDSDSQTLRDDDVLDITHESLIRNWKYLEQWAKEEFDNYTISLDFEQQLNRWVESGKSNDFLLSIGPLTYFENWFNNSKPNAHWIARYLPEEIRRDKKLANATQVLHDAQEFLNRSARKHIVTRTIMRYGPKRIAAVLAVIAVIVLSSFGIRDYFLRQNDSVLRAIKAESIKIVREPKLAVQYQVPAIIEQIILGNLTIPEVIDAIKEPKQKIRIATGIASQLVLQGRNEPKQEIFQSLFIADSLLQQFTVEGTGQNLAEGLKLINDFTVTSGLAHLYNTDESMARLVKNNAIRSARSAMRIFTTQPEDFNDIQQLSLALGNGINHKLYSPEEIGRLLQIISPFEYSKPTVWHERNYKREKILVRGSNNYGPNFNGLYQDLACLYAAAGKPMMALQCMDTLLRYQESFNQNDYASHSDNASNIAAVFYTYGTTDSLNSFVQGYCQRKNVKPEEFYNQLVSAALIEIDLPAKLNYYAGGGGQKFANLNLKFANDELVSFFFSKRKEEIMKNRDDNARNFELALLLKNESVFFGFRHAVRGTVDPNTGSQMKDAVTFYQQVSKDWLNQFVSIFGTTGADLISVPRKFLFLYPDYRVPFHPFETRRFSITVTSPVFISYVLDYDLFDILYADDADLKYFESWLLDYQFVMSSRDLFQHDPVPSGLLDRLARKLETRKANRVADLNILYLQLADQAFSKREIGKGIRNIQQVQPEKLLNSFNYRNFGVANRYSLELVGKAMAYLADSGRFEKAYDLLNVFKKEVNRSSLYGYASQVVLLNGGTKETAARLLDSAKAEMNRVDNLAPFQPNRHEVAIAMMYLDASKNTAAAYGIIKNSFFKFAAIQSFSRAFAYNDNLYEAKQQSPALISLEDKAAFLRDIVYGYNLGKTVEKKWENFRNNQFIFTREFLAYIDENQ